MEVVESLAVQGFGAFEVGGTWGMLGLKIALGLEAKTLSLTPNLRFRI